MTQTELQTKLAELMALPAETEWVEFKEAKTNFDFNELGRYFSALSNEANLKGKDAGWLVFGVTNKPPRQICNTTFRAHRADLDNLKHEVANQTNNRLTLIEIHEVATPQGRVVMFQIPPALKGLPTSWKGHFYGREGESIGALGIHEIDHLRSQGGVQDWSAQICEGATLNDLDPEALAFARREYKVKNPKLVADVDRWDDSTFLNKAKLTIGGKITRAALILLGKNEADHFLSPAIARITWVLKDERGIEKDYAHFGAPIILAVNQVFDKIRNLTYRHISGVSLFPTEVSQYDSWVIRETLNNCIAHQDYTQHCKINVVEMPDELLFTNAGEFLPGRVENAIRRDAPPEYYRNRFLAEAMVSLNMIDTIGSGIKRIFEKQRQRNFPMPDYDLDETQRVKVRITGKIIDEKFTRLLIAKTDLDLMDVVALDKVQKGKPIDDDEFASLKTQKLVEGRRKNLFVSAKIAEATETKADYIKKRGFDKDHYKKMVLSFMDQFGEATRPDIDNLLIDKISDALDESQKKNYVTNLLQEMRREGKLKIKGVGRWAKWSTYKPSV